MSLLYLPELAVQYCISITSSTSVTVNAYLTFKVFLYADA